MFDRLSTLIRQEVFPRLSLGHLAAVLLLGAGAFANFRYGLSFGTTDLERKIAGSASVGADVWNAVGLCLVALAIYGKRYVEAGAGAIVLCLTLAYSINAGLGFAASTRDAVITERAKLVRAEQSREADQAKIEGKIAALGASRGSRAVQVEIDGMLADQATDKQQASVGSADPLADLVVYFLGRVGYVVKPEDVRPWQNLLFVLLVVLGGPVAMWMAESRVWAAREASKAALEASRKPVQAETRPPKGDDTQPPAPTPTASVGSVPSVPVKNRVIQLTPAAARMLNKIQVSVQNGTDNALWAKSENAMAKSLNVARTSLRRAVAHLQEAGRVTVDDTNGYRLALA
jgi:hypothetical protein